MLLQDNKDKERYLTAYLQATLNVFVISQPHPE